MKDKITRVSWTLALSLFFVPLSSAYAKKVSIRWQEISGAIAYELQFQKNQRFFQSKTVNQTQWTGDLPTGYYSYRLRAVDRMSRAGLWGVPRSLVVMPSAPELSEPVEGKVFSYFEPKGEALLKWQGIEGVKKYRIQAKKSNEAVLQTLVEKNELLLKELPPGQYTWHVQAVIEADRNMQTALTQKSWDGKSSSDRTFIIEQSQLAAPEPIQPLGELALPKTGKLSFKWKKVEGAKAYEVRLERQSEIQRRPAQVRAQVKAFKTANDSLVLNVPEEGDYSWKVRAIASQAGPESIANFKLDRDYVSKSGSGYVAVSTMLAPYNYKIFSPEFANFEANTSSQAITSRVSGEYWFKPELAGYMGLDSTVFSINRNSYNRLSYEAGGKYHFSLGQAKLGWFLAPKIGLEGRDYHRLVVPDQNQPNALSSTRISVLGVASGIDLRRQLSERWSLGVKFSYFVPLSISGTSYSSQITTDLSYRNLNLGVQGLYWMAKNWGLGLGAFWDQRSISFRPADESRLNSELISMDAVYFFGSLVYSFGN